MESGAQDAGLSQRLCLQQASQQFCLYGKFSWRCLEFPHDKAAVLLSCSGANDGSIGTGHHGMVFIIQFQQDLVFSLQGTQGEHEVCEP